MRAHTEEEYEMGMRFAIMASATRGRSATSISSIALVVMVLGAAWLTAAPQAADARGAQDCGSNFQDKYSYWNLTAHNVSCKTAQRVADRYFRTGDHRFDGWKCDDFKSKSRPHGARTACQRDHESEKRIRYTFGK